jgi:hypothetical protein
MRDQMPISEGANSGLTFLNAECGNLQQARVYYGGQGRNRTADASLFRAALYQLSYLANREASLQEL